MSIGSHDTMTGCAIASPPHPNAMAMPGFKSASVVCGSFGRVLRVVIPHGLRHDASVSPPGPVNVKTCVVNVTSLGPEAPLRDATLFYHF